MKSILVYFIKVHFIRTVALAVLLTTGSFSTTFAEDPVSMNPATETTKIEKPPEAVLKMRDPFKAPEFKLKAYELLSELEKYNIDQFKLLGVITGPKHMKALIKAPDGKTYFVGPKTKIGTRQGVIFRMTTESIFIREKITNVLGEIENLDTEIILNKKEGPQT